MRTIAFAASALLLIASSAHGFSTESLRTVRSSPLVVNNWAGFGGKEYIPDGFTPESYKKFKQEEAKKKEARNLGRMGPRGFESRSMQSFQEALERGEASHLMPVFNAADKIKKGEIRPEDVPYMQRGGKWDNTDIRGAKNKKRWLAADKKYASGGYRKEQSVSIFGVGEGLDWTGKKARSGPAESIPAAQPKFAKNYKAPNIYNMKGAKNNKDEDKPKKKGGFFGLF